MLIKCPECDLPVSDKAISCPHCGYPMKPEQLEKTNSNIKRKRRMRLPNGFGQITEIKDKNLRNPFRVMVPAGKTEEGKPISKLLQPKAYFKTYNDAYTALLEYNKNPFEIKPQMTLQELYDKWLPQYEQRVGPGRVKIMKSCWQYMHTLRDVQVSRIRQSHIRDCIEHGTRVLHGQLKESPPPATQKEMRVLFHMLFDYAIELDIVDRNYARELKMIEAEPETERGEPHISFTDEEMKILWANTDVLYVDYILIQCYMGWRPGELIDLKTKDVYLDKNIIVGGKKTKAGKNRRVPIHPKIRPFVEKYYNIAVERGYEYIFKHHVDNDQLVYYMCRDKTEYLTYYKYFYRFRNVMYTLELNYKHKPHDARKQFVTMAKKYKLDDWAIKRIVGHAITDLTEGVYTDRDDEWLYAEICKIEAE